MAHPIFQRTKPHVNIGVISRKLQSMGFTATAASEISAGRTPSFPGDRELLVVWFLELVDQAGANLTIAKILDRA